MADYPPNKAPLNLPGVADEPIPEGLTGVPDTATPFDDAADISEVNDEALDNQPNPKNQVNDDTSTTKQALIEQEMEENL